MTLENWIKEHPNYFLLIVFSIGALTGIMQNVIGGVQNPKLWFLIPLIYGSSVSIVELVVRFGGQE